MDQISLIGNAFATTHENGTSKGHAMLGIIKFRDNMDQPADSITVHTRPCVPPTAWVAATEDYFNESVRPRLLFLETWQKEGRSVHLTLGKSQPGKGAWHDQP